MAYDLSDKPLVIRESLAAWNLLRILGFHSESIFFFVDDDGKIGVSLHDPDRGDMPIRVGTLPEGLSRQDAFDTWQEIANNMTEIPDEQIHDLWEQSKIRLHGAEIVLALISYGVTPPALIGITDLGDAAICKLVNRKFVEDSSARN